MSDKTDTQIPSDASDQAEPIRTSFSLDRLAREDIRQTSKRYGVSQAEIVNKSAQLFAFIAERSLQERKKRLATIKVLAEQAERSLNTMAELAPHLRGAFYMAQHYMNAAIDGEEDAIKRKRVRGAESEHDCTESDDHALIEKTLRDVFPELWGRALDLDELFPATELPGGDGGSQ
jgi:hypothetical protein